MTKKIRVALIGYGYAGKTFHAPLIAGTSDMELVAICSSDADKVHVDFPAIGVTNNPQLLFADPAIQLIVIASPNSSHFPLAQQALAAGKHVVVDKPFTVTLSQSHQLKRQVEQTTQLLSVFHNRRWDSDFLTLRALLKQGTLGEVVYFESHFDRYRPEVRQRWREQAGEGSGIWYDLGPHLIDQALQLFGHPQTVFVDLGQLRAGSPSVDYFHAVLSYAHRRVVLHGTMLAAAESARYIVHGTEGSFIKYGLDPQEERLKAGAKPPLANWGEDIRHGVVTLSHDGVLSASPLLTLPGNYPAYYAAISDAINGKAANPVPVNEAIHVMQMIELGLESAKQQKALPINFGF